MSLSLSSVLFYWSARYGALPVIEGTPVHTRNSAGIFADQRGVLSTAIINTPRLTWDTINGERRQTMLLEAASTNLIPYSEDFSQWSSHLTTVTGGQADPMGGTGATLLTPTGAGQYIYTGVAFTGDGTKAVSLYIKQGTSTENGITIYDSTASGAVASALINWTAGVPAVTASTGAPTIFPVAAMKGGWYRVSFAGVAVTAAHTNNILIDPDSTGGTGTVFAFGAQVEDAVVPSSYVKTVGSPASRAADQFYFDQSAPAPQAMAIYVRFIEQGTLLNGDGLIALNDGTSTAPQLLLYIVSGEYRIQHYNGSTSVASAVSTPPAIGQVVELIGWFQADGVVQMLQSIDGAPVTYGALSSTATPAAAWSGDKIVLNAYDSLSIGLARFAELKIVKLADIVSTTNDAIMQELRQFELGSNGGIL